MRPTRARSALLLILLAIATFSGSDLLVALIKPLVLAGSAFVPAG